MVLAWLIRAGVFVRRRLSDPVVDVLGLVIADACWMFLRGRRRTVMANLVRIAPGQPAAEYRRLARSTFRNLARSTSDVLASPSLTRQQILDLFETRGLQHLEAVYRRGKGAVVVTAHVGSPELAGLGVAALGYPCQAMAESISPRLDRLTEQIRGATGLRIAPLSRGAVEALRALGRKEFCVLVGDRAIGATGIPVRFAGGRRSLPRGPAAMAISTGAALLVAYVVRNPSKEGRRYLGVVLPEVLHEGMTPDDVPQLTQVIADHLSAVVQEFPDQWFVFQPGWEDDGPPLALGPASSVGRGRVHLGDSSTRKPSRRGNEL